MVDAWWKVWKKTPDGPQVERQIESGMEDWWNRKTNGPSVVETGSRGQKTLADVIEESRNRRIDEMHGQQIQGHINPTQDLFFSFEETVPGSTYSVENQLNKRSFWSWKPFVASWICSQNRNHSIVNTHKQFHLVSLWLVSFLLFLRSWARCLSPMALVLR